MPLLSCILCLANHALLSGLCYLLLKLVVYVSKKPIWVEHMPSLNRVNPKVFTSHTYLVLHQVKLSTTIVIFEIREVNERLCIEEVGVDLELCVHAHGHDVHLLIEASFKINYSLGISSSYI